jgi:peptidoglycan pentaglycine glycine transferase (the first glycine)
VKTRVPSDSSTNGLRVALIGEEEATDWNSFVAAHPNGHLLQSWEWGCFKGRFGWTPVRLGIRNGAGKIEAAASVLFRHPAPGIPMSIAYVPRGPVMACNSGPAEIALLAALHRLCRGNGSILLAIEPNCETDPHTERLLMTWGFRATRRVQPSRSIWLDLQPGQPEEALSGAMKQKTRYNIRLALRRGVTVREASGAVDLEAFHALLKITGERDEFHVDNLAYYRDLLSDFTNSPPSGGASSRLDKPAAILFLAFHPSFSGPLAGLMAFAFGLEAIYMYGATANFGREHMSAYLLQWEAMRWARRMGCKRYDFWGISPDPTAQAPAEASNANVRHGLWGVYRFKQGFGGREVTYPGAWNYVYRPMLYPLYERFLAWRYKSDQNQH